MKQRIRNGLATRLAISIALSCAPIFAQGPLSNAASGITVEMISAVRYIAILVVIGMALWITVSHNHGVVGRVVATLVGLYVALNPQMVANWIQSL